MNVAKDRAVQIHYHLSDSDGNVIDSSRGGDTLGYLHGHGQLVAGVENALDGKAAGASLSVVVPPEEGYGVRDDALDVGIPLSAFPPESHDQIKAGVMFEGAHPSEEGASAVFTIVEVLPDRVHATANHALAGVTLHFELEVVSVRAATDEELAHGHLHGPGGHHHH